MATAVYEIRELVLQDGSTVSCKPAPISILRKGNKMLSVMDNIDDIEDPNGELTDDDKGVRKVLEIVAVCLKAQRPDFYKQEEVENPDGSVTKRTVVHYELMEDLFDLDTMFKVIELELGWKLNDPNLVEAATQLALLKQQDEERQKESSGTTSTSQTEKEKSSSLEDGETSKT